MRRKAKTEGILQKCDEIVTEYIRLYAEIILFMLDLEENRRIFEKDLQIRTEYPIMSNVKCG